MKLDKCIFCDIPPERVIAENAQAYVIRDGYPVSNIHSLIIPKRHLVDFFDLTEKELIACYSLIIDARSKILELDKTVRGFNVGTNSGKAGGQTIFHCHIHLIPRRDGDVDNPRGGVRHVIPGKGNY